MLRIAKEYINTLKTASQNQQVRQRSASQQIENNSERINTLLDNAAKTLKTSTETPTAAVYAKNSINIQSNLDVLLEQTQQNKQTHTVYFCFTFEDAGFKGLVSRDKTTTYRLILYKYKQNKQEKQEFKIGYIDKEILGVKEEKHVIGKNDFDATKFVKYVMEAAMDVNRLGYFINATPGIDNKYRSTELSLGNILGRNIDRNTVNKVNLEELINKTTQKGGIKFIPIVPPSNSGGYRKKHTRRYKKHTRRHRRTYTKK